MRHKNISYTKIQISIVQILNEKEEMKRSSSDKALSHVVFGSGLELSKKDMCVSQVAVSTPLRHLVTELFSDGEPLKKWKALKMRKLLVYEVLEKYGNYQSLNYENRVGGI